MVNSVFFSGCSKNGTFGAPTNVATAKTAPSGYTFHTSGSGVEQFEMAVPDDWIILRPTPEKIDAMIEKYGKTDPQIVPMLEALKTEPDTFWAMDPSDLTHGASVSVEARFAPSYSLNMWLGELKLQVRPMLTDLLSSENITVGGDKALKVRMETHIKGPNGDTSKVRLSMVTVAHKGYYFQIVMAYPPESSDRYEPIFDTMIESFSIRY